MSEKVKYEKAKEIADEILEKIDDIIVKGIICGSIRRKKEMVHDIDLVVIPKSFFTFAGDVLERLKPSKITKEGNKLIQFFYNGVQVDLYITNKKNFETIKLIRSGSASHNIKLCKLAQKKGWKLKASGMGLVDENNKVIVNTEKGILEKLLGKYVPPEERF